MKIQMIKAMVVLALTLGGCAAEPSTTRSPELQVNPNFVTPSPLMLEMADAAGDEHFQGNWEFARNDPRIHQKTMVPDVARFGIVVQHDRQRLRISNGRPREYSNFRTNGYTRRLER